MPLRRAGTGPIYLLCWPLYTAAPASRWLAASVVVAAGLQFALVGSGTVRSEALVAGVSVRGLAAGRGLLREELFWCRWAMSALVLLPICPCVACLLHDMT